MPVDIDARVLSNTRLSSDYNVVRLAAPEIARQSKPGQFVMVRPGRNGEPFLRRPFSVFEVLRDASGSVIGLSLLNKQIGIGTRLIFALEPGDRLPCLGPLGQPFTPVRPPTEAWMVAGGVGLAPFALLAESLRSTGSAMTLFYGARRAAELVSVDFFERLGVRPVLTTEDGSRGETGLIIDPLAAALQRLPEPSSVTLYACGPTPMLAAVARLAAAYGHPAQVSLEQVMGCGLGGCYSCVVQVRNGQHNRHYVRACIEGPVFSSDKVVWETLAR
jgi:dihydroorotate dehydrogenase electron transfer subunit